MKHKIIYDPVFRSETLFYCCESGGEALAHAKKKYNVSIAGNGFNGFKGTCIELICNATGIAGWLVWVKNHKDWKCMVHEAAHVCFNILEKRLVGYTGGNNETFCYLQEFFATEFWDVMCKKARKKK